jgi:hypothetical protein
MTFQVLTAANMKMAVFWAIALTESTSISETSVNFYQTTRRNNPEDRNFHNRRREKLKSHYVKHSLLTAFQLKISSLWFISKVVYETPRFNG